MDCDLCGFEEIPHTADWALRIWTPDFPVLVSTATFGMQSMMGLVLQSGRVIEKVIAIEATDQEAALVIILSEVLYFLESDQMGVTRCECSSSSDGWNARLSLSPVVELAKEIKAVTFHRLVIQPSPRGLETTLVFDV